MLRAYQSALIKEDIVKAVIHVVAHEATDQGEVVDKATSPN